MQTPWFIVLLIYDACSECMTRIEAYSLMTLNLSLHSTKGLK